MLNTLGTALHCSTNGSYAHDVQTRGAAPLALLDLYVRERHDRRSGRDHHFRLNKTGGSRGNPGPGGAGAVIVRVDALQAAPTIVWSAAMSLASTTTTNNQAEYTGLVTGLAAAQHNRWTPLHVVGDSALIIDQLRDYRPPKNDILRSSYATARGIADQLGVAGWSHHLRAFNKMADAAANVAMDTRRSIQSFHPTSRPEWDGLGQLLAGDFAKRGQTNVFLLLMKLAD